jgi:hypothetical protein
MGRRGEKYSIKTVKEIVQYILEKERRTGETPSRI